MLQFQIGSRSLRLGANRRLKLRQSLGQDCVQVLSLLVSDISITWDHVVHLRCD